MANSISHGARSTAAQVLAGIDLTRKSILVTGCSGGIGFETMNALAANGAHVIGLARSLASAKNACEKVGPSSTPIACDLGDLDSVAAASEMIRGLQVPLDAIITNAGIAAPPTLLTRYGIEMQFDNLDGDRFYNPLTFYGQSKLAAALYAKELSHRLRGRGIAVNSLHPGATTGTGLNRNRGLALRIGLSAARLLMKSPSQGAATEVLLAASPRVAGITGEYWSNCRIAVGNSLLNDGDLAKRLWKVSTRIVAAQDSSQSKSMQAAA
jgi:WW domain-containing oxidoreductase